MIFRHGGLTQTEQMHEIFADRLDRIENQLNPNYEKLPEQLEQIEPPLEKYDQMNEVDFELINSLWKDHINNQAADSFGEIELDEF